MTRWVSIAFFFASEALGAPTVRLLVASGLEGVQIQGRSLRLTDGDLADLLLERDGPIAIRALPDGLAIAGTEVRPRSVLVRGQGLCLLGRTLIGEVEIETRGAGLAVINRLSLERYLVGILGAEMGPDWPLEALRAQAVAARSYFLNRRLQREAASYDLEASTLDQVYLGISRESARTDKAVRSTRGEVLAFSNLPAEALFHACCGGTTRASEEVFGQAVPYLRSTPDPDCGGCPKHRWTKVIPLSALDTALQKTELVQPRTVAGQDDLPAPVRRRADVLETRACSRAPRCCLQSVRCLDPEPCKRIEVRGWHGERHAFDPVALRRLLGEDEVPSATFTAEVKGDSLRLTGQGSGHGVGLCQWGARGMAERGEGYRAILERYYPGAQVRKIY